MDNAVCRFCLDDVSSENNPFMHPCMCKGSVENVHLRCLLRWVYQCRDNDTCNMCKTLYVYEIKQLEERQKAVAAGENIDWGNGESLAFATLLDEGFPIRITGQDSGRGTFF